MDPYDELIKRSHENVKTLSEKIKEFFPEFIHRKHLVGTVAVQKKRLAKERQIPVKNKEYNNYHFIKI